LPRVARRAALALAGARTILPAIRARLLPGELAEEVVLLDEGQRIVRVGTADDAGLERIHAQLRLVLEAAHESGAHEAGRHHLRGELAAERQVAEFPARDAVLEELVARGEFRMALRGALHLHDFLDGLPALPALGILLRDRGAVEGLRGVHAAVRQVAVVRDRERTAAGALLVGLHPVPEFLRVLAVPGREREHLARASLTVAQQHVAVQVVAARRRRPLEADERGELPGLVVLVGHDGRALPDRHHQRARDLRVGQHRWQCVGRLRADQLGHRRRGLGAARLDHATPPLDGAVAHQLRVALVDLGDESEPLGVVAQDDEVERPRQARRQARRRNHLLAAGDAVGLLGREAIAGRERVTRVGAVQVGVAPQDARRVLAAGVRRIGLRLGRRLARRDGNVHVLDILHDAAHRHVRCQGGLRTACLSD